MQLSCLTQMTHSVHRLGGTVLFLRCPSQTERGCLREDDLFDLNSIEASSQASTMPSGSSAEFRSAFPSHGIASLNFTPLCDRAASRSRLAIHRGPGFRSRQKRNLRRAASASHDQLDARSAR